MIRKKNEDKKQLKIAVITDFFWGQYFGGGERRHFETLKRLVNKGHSIDVYCMRTHTKLPKKIEGIRIHEIGPKIKNPPKRGIFQMIYFISQVFMELKKSKYDVYEAQGIGIIPLSMLKFIGKKNTISIIHDMSTGGKDQWFMLGKIATAIEKIVYKLPSHKIITVSDNIKKRLVLECNIEPNKIFVVHNGVDEKLIDNVRCSEKNNSIIFVGRLIPHKHPKDLIKAFLILFSDKKIIKKYPDLNLKIIGDGPDMKKLKTFSSSSKLSSKIRFYGNVKKYEDVIKNVKRSKILVLPSTREGFGMVLAEAMYSGTPVIAYRSDGASEVIKNNVDGILVEQRNIKKLVSSITKILMNKKVYDTLRKNGKEKVKKKFLWDITAKKILDIYKIK